MSNGANRDTSDLSSTHLYMVAEGTIKARTRAEAGLELESCTEAPQLGRSCKIALRLENPQTKRGSQERELDLVVQFWLVQG
jgi:hypothetical protein